MEPREILRERAISAGSPLRGGFVLRLSVREGGGRERSTNFFKPTVEYFNHPVSNPRPIATMADGSMHNDSRRYNTECRV